MKRIALVAVLTLPLLHCDQPDEAAAIDSDTTCVDDRALPDGSTDEFMDEYVDRVEAAYAALAVTGDMASVVCVNGVCGKCSVKKIIPPAASCWIVHPGGWGCSVDCSPSGCVPVCW